MRPLCASTLVLLLIGLQGCGGGGEEATTTPLTAEQQAPAKAPAAAKSAAQAQGEPGNKSFEEPAQPSTAPSGQAPVAEPVPGTKAVAPGVPTTNGGDNSIQAFGTEGESEEATQALAAFGEYTRARLAGDWQGACKAASGQFRKQLKTIAEGAKPAKEGAQIPEGCAEMLELVAGGAPAASLRQIAQVKRELSFRVRPDGYAYLIYEDGEGAVRFIAMARDSGSWRVNTLEPSVFPEPGNEGSAQ